MSGIYFQPVLTDTDRIIACIAHAVAGLANLASLYWCNRRKRIFKMQPQLQIACFIFQMCEIGALYDPGFYIASTITLMLYAIFETLVNVQILAHFAFLSTILTENRISKIRITLGSITGIGLMLCIANYISVAITGDIYGIIPKIWLYYTMIMVSVVCIFDVGITIYICTKVFQTVKNTRKERNFNRKFAEFVNLMILRNILLFIDGVLVFVGILAQLPLVTQLAFATISICGVYYVVMLNQLPNLMIVEKARKMRQQTVLQMTKLQPTANTHPSTQVQSLDQ